MPTVPLKILIAEDDELFRLGLKMRLEQENDFEVVGEAPDGEAALELIRKIDPDIVILDIGLPGIGGIETCRLIKQHNSRLLVLVLTSHSQSTLFKRLIEAGADGYCLKGINCEKLFLAIRSVASGASWWDSNATEEIREAIAIQPINLTPKSYHSLNVNPLTSREQEILALVSLGKSNQQIASILHITPGTVRVHVHTIFSKLNVNDRFQAASLAIEKKFINNSNS